MLEIIKIEEGLNWDGFNRFYTNDNFELGYEVTDSNYISIELNNQIYCLGADSVTIDGIEPLDSNHLVSLIFG